ncbi:sigma-54-dependent Fis family transcriptional regulator [Deferribacteraceae bacterium V6Fe1]|nr:sigma-54-dependent Fis family transcriptional regulator [Deferribacteraceae bacterium V6Fe1]
MKLKVLVVDDDKNSREIIKMGLQKDYDVKVAYDGIHAYDILKKEKFDVIICDFVMNELDGLELLRRIKSEGNDAIFILITAFGTSELTIKSIQEGAYEYLSKPFKIKDLKRIIENYEKRQEAAISVENNNNTETENKDEIIANSPNFVQILKELAKIAKSEMPVLILGESGTGKEVIANLIHKYSNRKNNEFFAVNCNAIPASLLESELFGYEKGAFTGADKDKKGYFELANNGTLFLDEIGDLELDIQVKLLRVLQENTIRRVGGKKEIKLNVRYIFATNVNLENKVKDGKFRKDLYFRLKVAEIKLPPLRERKLDILPLANYFLKKYAEGDEILKLSKEAEKCLLKYDFPGNIRELENVIRNAIVKAKDSGVILKTDLNLCPIDKAENVLVDKNALIKALDDYNGNKVKVAEALGISRSTLYRMLDRHGIK